MAEPRLPFKLSKLAYILSVVLIVQIVYVALTWDKARAPSPPPAQSQSQAKWSILTGSHQVAAEIIKAPFTPGSGGAIETVGEDLFLVTRAGDFHHLKSDTFEPLAIPSPVDIEVLSAAFNNEESKASVGVKDLLIRPRGGIFDLYVTHTALSETPDGSPCAHFDVSTLSAIWSAEGLRAEGGWRRIFRADPCLSFEDKVTSLQSGGMLALTPGGDLLATVGDHGFDNVYFTREGVDPQSDASDYGKIFLIDLATEEAEVFSRGHRNNSGLAIGPDGTIWSTEHGPRGGDELNLIEQGEDYGWPRQSYGTIHGNFDWPGNPPDAQHALARRPVFSWVPSIGVSGVLVSQGEEFPRWEGDLMIVSLGAETMFRARAREGRVIFLEPIFSKPKFLLGRIRQITQTERGVIYIQLANVPQVIRFTNDLSGADDLDGSSIAFCAGCHQVSPGVTAEVVGPSLVGVVGREIASVGGYPYSAGLKALDGVWTPDRLMNVVWNTYAVAPGTSMPPMDMSVEDMKVVVSKLAETGGE